ncbi:hypothetical protein M8J75_000990 [Diaphorina citri]|nr:hypothetical protein M8J75_000990 [Diaphorina citri]
MIDKNKESSVVVNHEDLHCSRVTWFEFGIPCCEYIQYDDSGVLGSKVSDYSNIRDVKRYSIRNIPGLMPHCNPST